MMRILRKCLLMVLCLVPSALSASGDDAGMWVSAGLEKELVKGLDAGFEAEYRLRDHFRATDRWGAGLSVSYRLYRNASKTFSLKADAGVKYMKTYTPENIVLKGTDHGFQEYNADESYALDKIRTTVSVNGAFETGRFRISLRERFQFTANDSVLISETKWRYSKSFGELVPAGEEEEWKGTDNRRYVLRSRLLVEYDIPKCKIDPYVSVELYNDIADRFGLQKLRYQAGVEYKLHKKHGFKLYYAYQKKSDGDEPGGHIVGVNYCFSI